VQLKNLQSKAKSATKNVGNPAQDFANKGKKTVAQAKPAFNKAKVRIAHLLHFHYSLESATSPSR
jgi:hypothetical protein